MSPPHEKQRHLWQDWILANALGEVAGLGATALLGFGVVSLLPHDTSLLTTLVSAFLMVAAGGLIEGGAVGLAQWRVLRRVFPALSRAEWLRATIIGAAVAWTLGMIPSTLMSATPSSGSAPPPELSPALTYMLAAGMGLILGPILALPQWLVLRRYVAGAWLWIPAHALAWAAGMVAVFVGIDRMIATTSLFGRLAAGGLTLAATGAIVGAIHGLALIRFARLLSDRAVPEG